MAHRRGNKSNKVPNVKLRPAAPSSSTASRKSSSSLAQDSLRTHDSGFDSEYDSSIVDMRIPRPFRGVILCATGVNDKTTLFKQAIELGAQPLHDLTDKVTHLLAVEPGSAKYRCALQHRIQVMHPSWISDSYQIWLKGDDVDYQQSLRKHRLPVFSNVVICVSGLDDVPRRTEINRRVTEEGGSAADAMTEKMHYAARFNKQREADIRLVWEEWFWDSLRLGGRCDEDAYDIAKPRPVRQASPELASSPPAPSPPAVGAGHELRDVPPVRKRDAGGALDGDEEEAAVAVKRIPAVTLQIWGSILRPRGFELQHGKLIRSPSKLQISLPPADAPEPSPTKVKGNRIDTSSTNTGEELSMPQSALATIRRTHTYAKDSHQRLFKRAPTLPELGAPSFTEDPCEDDRVPSSGSSSRDIIADGTKAQTGDARLFAGRTFRMLGEARCARVRDALQDAGGKIVGGSPDVIVDFVIVRLVSGSKLYREEIDELYRAKFRTECWLERCLSCARICPPDDHISFTPLKTDIPVPGAQAVDLSLSGLEESEALWVGRLARALGMNVSTIFSRRSTHLLCPSRTGAKYEKAKEWDVPVVDMQWLTSIATSGQIGTPEDCVVSSPHPHSTSEAQERAKPSEKGKERAGTHAIEHGASHRMQVRSQERSDHQSAPQSSPIGDKDYLAVETFGEPVGLLHVDPSCADEAENLKSSTPSGSIPEYESGSVGHSAMSLAELRHDMQNTRIPSSASPSPIKVPSSSNSPAKISREATKVLQESITSLLGKRLSTEDVESNSSTRSKRPRPPSRTKQQIVIAQEREYPLPPAVRSTFGPFVVPEEDASMLAAERGTVEDAVRVTYEDPAQSNEKLRLMKLLETQRPQEIWETGSSGKGSTASSEGSCARTKRPRRSTRVAGF